MKYFLIETDKRLRNQPEPINWYKQIDERNVHMGSYNKIKKRNMFKIKPNKNVEFPDVISFPFFLISNTVREILKKYSPNVIFKTFIYLDSENQNYFEYNLPTLDEIDCLSAESEFNLDRSVIKKIVIDNNKLEDAPLFYIGNVKSRYVIARMDFIESVLKKNVKGINLTEIEVINE